MNGPFIQDFLPSAAYAFVYEEGTNKIHRRDTKQRQMLIIIPTILQK